MVGPAGQKSILRTPSENQGFRPIYETNCVTALCHTQADQRSMLFCNSIPLLHDRAASAITALQFGRGYVIAVHYVGGLREPMQRRAEFRPFSWLHDLWQRNQIDLSPPYQRRSVWPERFRTEFVTTALLNYPCPAIFLFEEIRPDGSFMFKVVDGKQRLTTLFDFVSGRIQIGEDFPNMALRGRLFDDLDDQAKLGIWRYAFSVEFVEQENEALINDVFNRINKNVAKLSQQELRHAQFSGRFITAAETLADYMDNRLTPNFPSIAAQSRRQMKEVENVANLLLFIEQGERSVSQSDLDKAFADREEEWPEENDSVNEFTSVVDFLFTLTNSEAGGIITASRLRNQADFYSLFAAIVELRREGALASPEVSAERLSVWVGRIRQIERGELPADNHPIEIAYLDAARAASNDAGPRRTRITALRNILLGL